MLPESWFDGCVGGSPGTEHIPCFYYPTVSEINYKSAPSADAGDWIEFFNPTFLDLDLGGWQIRDGNDNTYTIPAGTMLPSATYWVFYQDGEKFAAQFPDVANASGPLGFGLNGDGDMVRLFSPDGRLFLSLCFDDAAPWPDGPDGGGYTLENEPFATNLSDAASWFAGCLGGSPGQDFDPSCVVGTDALGAPSSALRVWPNPARDVVHAQMGSGESAFFTLLDVLGRPVMRQAAANGAVFFPIKNLSRGVYFVEGVAGSGRGLARVVVE
jgi:hypothetical protein